MSHGKAQTAIAATKTNIKTRKWQEWGSDISRQSTDQIAATKTENSKKTQKLLEKLGKETEELRDSQYKLLQNNDSFDLKENSEANDVYLEDIPP